MGKYHGINTCNKKYFSLHFKQRRYFLIHDSFEPAIHLAWAFGQSTALFWWYIDEEDAEDVDAAWLLL